VICVSIYSIANTINQNAFYLLSIYHSSFEAAVYMGTYVPRLNGTDMSLIFLALYYPCAMCYSTLGANNRI